jgi:hypothetical protein
MSHSIFLMVNKNISLNSLIFSVNANNSTSWCPIPVQSNCLTSLIISFSFHQTVYYMFIVPITQLGTFITSIPGFRMGDFNGMYSKLFRSRMDIELNNLVASMANSPEHFKDYEHNNDLCTKNESLEIFDQVSISSTFFMLNFYFKVCHVLN